MTMSIGIRMLDLPSFENNSRQQPKLFIFSCPEKACVQNQAWVEVLHFSLLSRLLNIQTTFIFLLHMLVRSLPFPSLTSESFSPRDLQLCYKGHHLFPLQKESVRFVNHSYGNDSVHALCFTSKRDDQLRNSDCGQLLRSIQRSLRITSTFEKLGDAGGDVRWPTEWSAWEVMRSLEKSCVRRSRDQPCPMSRETKKRLETDVTK